MLVSLSNNPAPVLGQADIVGQNVSQTSSVYFKAVQTQAE